MTCGVYQIVNTVNGKRYVGSSVDIEKRWQSHQLELRKGTHHAQHLQRSWNKYGCDKFTMRVILECEREELITNEQAELDKGYDYNSSPTAGNTLGLKFSDDARARVRASRKRMLEEDPEGFKARMSAISKGKPKPAHWVEATKDRLAGVPKTDEHKKAMAISRADLSRDTVILVRQMRELGMSLPEIAGRCGVSWAQAQRICSGERYQWAYDYAGPVEIKKAPD